MAYIGFYATGMIVSTRVSQANRGIVALIAGLVLTFATSGVAIKYGESDAQEIFWLFFPFWNAQAFISSEYAHRSPPYDIETFNNPSANVKNNSFGYGYDLESSFARNIGFAALTGMIVLYCVTSVLFSNALSSFLLQSLASAWYALVLIFLKFSDWRKQR